MFFFSRVGVFSSTVLLPVRSPIAASPPPIKPKNSTLRQSTDRLQHRLRLSD